MRQFNPKNSIQAFLFFLFGSFFIWWTHDKINVFTSVFENAFPKVIVWGMFILMYALWIFIIPYLVATGASISIKQFLNVFKNGFIGLLATIIVLPIGQTLITALSGIFTNVIISAIGWIVMLTIVIYTGFWKPIEAITNDTE